MSEIKDTYGAIHESLDATHQDKLSALQQQVQKHIGGSTLETLGSALMGEKSEGGVKLQPHDLMATLYAGRLSKDIIVDELTPDKQGDKNEKAGWLDKIGDALSNKFADALVKQKDSYDAVLAKLREPVIQQFQKEFDELKSAIGVPKTEAIIPQSSPSPTENNHEQYSENSHYTDDEKKQIEEVISSAKTYQGVVYKYGGNDSQGIDCSGLWSKAFDKEYQESNKRFGRLTAAIFDTKAPDISREEVERGDWMFWEDPEGVKQGGRNEKGEKIYHIEMVVGKPFEKDGKRYVKTYGSSSEKHIIDDAGNDTGKG